MPHMARALAETDLAQWLDAEIKQRGWGVRTLARHMTDPGEDPEIARRCLNRVLFEGSNPSPENRALIADGLGVPVAEVPDPTPFQREAA